MRIPALFLIAIAAVAIASPVRPANLLEKRQDGTVAVVSDLQLLDQQAAITMADS